MAEEYNLMGNAFKAGVMPDMYVNGFEVYKNKTECELRFATVDFNGNVKGGVFIRMHPDVAEKLAESLSSL